MTRLQQILVGLYEAATYDLTQLADHFSQKIMDRWPDVDAYREPEEAVQSRPCIRPPAQPQLRATKTPYLSVVVDKTN